MSVRERGGQKREDTEAQRRQRSLRPVRDEHNDPVIPESVTAAQLPSAARNTLKTLQDDTQEIVARHLAMSIHLLESDPQLAHQHAISAVRRAGRIPAAREMLAVTAYHVGDYALSLRELRTFRRLSGSQARLALMVECERAMGRPERGIETGLAALTRRMTAEQRVYLAIAMSGARLDLGQTEQALLELEIAELTPHTAYPWSPELFAAYAGVLDELGRHADAASWRERADIAESALNEQRPAASDYLEVVEVDAGANPPEPPGRSVRR